MDELAEPRAVRVRSALTGQELRRKDSIRLDTLRADLVERMRQDQPDLDLEGVVSWQEVTHYRGQLVEDLLHAEKRDITALEREVIDSLAEHQTVADNVEQELEADRTFGERAADHVASFGGSWQFIILFGAVLVAMAVRAFDPYPFILLNLVLSCLAAVQAPIIMMSQRRTEAKDRARSLNDYQVNLKAELEIRHLHEKMDHLMTRQWERLAELQRLQIELIQELLDKRRKPTGEGRPEALPLDTAGGGAPRPALS